MAAVVKETTDNFYKIHRVLISDSSFFQRPGNKIEAGTKPAGELPNSALIATPNSPASMKAETKLIGELPNSALIATSNSSASTSNIQ